MTQWIHSQYEFAEHIIQIRSRVIPFKKFGPLEINLYGEHYRFPEGRLLKYKNQVKLENCDGSPYCHPYTYFDGILDTDSGPLENVLFCKDVGIPVRTKEQLSQYRIQS